MRKTLKGKIKGIIQIPMEASQTLSAEFSPRIRPIMRVIIYFGTFILLIIVAPIFAISRLFTKNRPNAIKNLQVELETKWYSESNAKALIELRKVYDVLRDRMEELMHNGIIIEPYGKFKFNDYLTVVEWLYHYEMRLGNWDKANEMCDIFLEPLLKRKDKMKGAIDKYIVYKAKAIYQISGNTAAQEYLLKYIDNDRKDSPINVFLYELRDEPK